MQSNSPVQFHAIESGFFRSQCSSLEQGNELLGIVDRRRGDVTGFAFQLSKLATSSGNGRRSDVRSAFLQERVRDASDMPQLREDRAVVFVHAVDDFLPTSDLLIGVDAR